MPSELVGRIWFQEPLGLSGQVEEELVCLESDSLGLKVRGGGRD